MARSSVEKRLAGYWKMEAGNVLLVPAAIGMLALSLDWRLGPATLVALIPVCLLLAIGAYYWRTKLHQLQTASPFPRQIGVLARLQYPSLFLTAAALIVAVASWGVPDLARSTAERWVVTICAVLAALEYINYYHRQVQHFDNMADWRRLWSGRGFRRSQMAADIARWRALK